jgi:GntR family transcriptional regulator
MSNTPSLLERDSAQPLYEQITDRLRRDLSDRSDFNEQLPTEEDLMARYEVSRSTVRKAVQRLVDEGLLIRRQGKGTFLTRPLPHIVHSIDRLAPFMETFKGAGTNVRTELIDFTWTSKLELPPRLAEWERPLLSYQRRYESDGVAHAVVHVVLPHGIAREVNRSSIESTTVYQLLSNLGIVLAKSEFLVSCRQPSAKLAEALDISQSSFLLVLERITYASDGKPVEMTTHYLRPDIYQLSVALKDVGSNL